ncbi:MAG TPA: L,D-transpeptidase family protein [Usitatibacter sp.]
MLHPLLAGVLSLGMLSPLAPRSAGVGRAAPVRGPGGPVALADSIVIEKKAHRLTLYHMGSPLRSYRVALGGTPVGDKRSRGDRRTPEGLFSVDGMNENSDFHLALHLSYPDERHQIRADSLGIDPGGDIMIHGLPKGRGKLGGQHRAKDWTNGCVALTDEEMEQIWNMVPIGIPVEIKP